MLVISVRLFSSMEKKKTAFAKIIRVSEWWEYKFTPIIGTVFATAVLLNPPLILLLQYLLILIISLIPGAAYVSILNDLTDIEDDKKAGKSNNFINNSTLKGYILLGICLLLGLIVCSFLDKYSLTFYLSAWIVFTLYSLPPIRLKNRGFLGVIADASGANMFPQLFAVALLSKWMNKQIDFTWLSIVGIWSLFWGIRVIIWHQLIDRKNDLKSSVKTFVQQVDLQTVIKLCERLTFPLEITAFIGILVYTNNFLSLFFIVLYAFCEWLRYIFWQTEVSIISISNDYRLVMDEYYNVFFPISFILLLVVILSPVFFIILLIYLIFFPSRIYQTIREIHKLITTIKQTIIDYINWE